MSEESRKELAEKVKVYRKHRKLNQKQLAEMAGINILTLQKLEAGGNVSLEILDRVEDVLKVRLY